MSGQLFPLPYRDHDEKKLHAMFEINSTKRYVAQVSLFLCLTEIMMKRNCMQSLKCIYENKREIYVKGTNNCSIQGGSSNKRTLLG